MVAQLKDKPNSKTKEEEYYECHVYSISIPIFYNDAFSHISWLDKGKVWFSYKQYPFDYVAFENYDFKISANYWSFSEYVG